MLTTIAIAIAALIAIAVTTIGSFYVFSPERVVSSFGLKLPSPDANTRAWLHLKGVRDIGCGLLVLILLLTADHRTVGTALLALAVIPFGDMSVVLATGGSRSAAFSIHGLTCGVMLLAGLSLIHVF